MAKKAFRVKPWLVTDKNDPPVGLWTRMISRTRQSGPRAGQQVFNGNQSLRDLRSTGIDRTIPVSYWCDCAESNVSYLGRAVPQGAFSSTIDTPHKLVPTTTAKDNLCAYCGYQAIVRRLASADWIKPDKHPNNTVIHRAITATSVVTGDIKKFTSLNHAAQELGLVPSALGYALRINKPVKGWLWSYDDGRGARSYNKNKNPQCNNAKGKKKEVV